MAGFPIGAIGGIVEGVVGIGQTAYGDIKSRKAKKEIDQIEANSPIYSRPDEIKQLLEQAKTNANSQMPGTSLYEQNAQQSTQGALTSLQDNGRLDADAITKLYQQELSAYQNLNVNQAQYNNQQQANLSNALATNAQYADQEFEYNVNSKWQRKYQNKINEYVSYRDMFKQGVGTQAHSGQTFASAFGGGAGGGQ